MIAPLDWGLGHATRCIPVIQALIDNDFIVTLAAEGNAANLLQKEFPDLTIFPLTGYNISYSNNRIFFITKLIAQIPKILKAIKHEHNWLEQIIEKHKIEIIISDNRYGLYNSKIKSIFITHQLEIETGKTFINKWLQKINYKSINKFDECWIPDEEKPFDLAGKLSHPKILPKVISKYIGVLSRFKKQATEKNIDLLVLISGPEPQRTNLEKGMLLEMAKHSFKMVMVRGLPAETNNLISKNKSLVIYNHLSALELNVLIQSAKVTIARSGYSTIMDLIKLNQKAILIPTPGQTEQEYLAKYLAAKKYFIAANQSKFNLEREIKNIEDLEQANFPLVENTKLKDAIQSLK